MKLRFILICVDPWGEKPMLHNPSWINCGEPVLHSPPKNKAVSSFASTPKPIQNLTWIQLWRASHRPAHQKIKQWAHLRLPLSQSKTWLEYNCGEPVRDRPTYNKTVSSFASTPEPIQNLTWIQLWRARLTTYLKWNCDFICLDPCGGEPMLHNPSWICNILYTVLYV